MLSPRLTIDEAEPAMQAPLAAPRLKPDDPVKAAALQFADDLAAEARGNVRSCFYGLREMGLVDEDGCLRETTRDPLSPTGAIGCEGAFNEVEQSQ